MEAIVPGQGRVGVVRPLVSPREAAVRCPTEAVARPVTSSSRRAACGSSGRCSRPPHAARRVVLVRTSSESAAVPSLCSSWRSSSRRSGGATTGGCVIATTLGGCDAGEVRARPNAHLPSMEVAACGARAFSLACRAWLQLLSVARADWTRLTVYAQLSRSSARSRSGSRVRRCRRRGSARGQRRGRAG
jgi:hypothetical protein